LKCDYRKKYTRWLEKKLTVNAENLIKIAIHNFEKNEYKFFAKIP